MTMLVQCVVCDRPVANQYAPSATCEDPACSSNRPKEARIMATQLQDNTRTYTEKELLELGWRPPVPGIDYERWREALHAFYVRRNTSMLPNTPLDSVDREYIDALVTALSFAPEPYRHPRV
jgi:hypothetical protein